MDEKKRSIVYAYRMTHDYGINPCCFNGSFEPTPELLTLGGCKPTMQNTICKKYRSLLENKDIDIYIIAIAGHSKDRGCKKDKNGISLITSNYEALMYVAKVSNAITRKEYLQNQKYNDRADAILYRSAKEKNPPAILLSNDFVYYGKSAKTIDHKIIDLLAKKQGYKIFNSGDKSRAGATTLLLSFIQNELNSKGSVIGRPFNKNPKF